MKVKCIRTDEMDKRMQDELKALMQSLANKYGANAVNLGVHIENLTNAKAVLVQNSKLEGDALEGVKRHTDAAILSVIRDLGQTWGVSPKAAFAVADALQEHARYMEAEIIGEAAMGQLSATEKLAKEVLAKAAS